jgi:hypothetical protein
MMNLTLPPLGILLSTSVLHTGWFAVLASFVAINTMMYGALALAKILPKLYPSDWAKPINRRTQTRSIYPEGMPARQAR